MHELSVAESLIKIITEKMAKYNLDKLLKIKMMYKQLSAIVPETLDTTFEVLTLGTPLAGAVMELEQKPMAVRCRRCGHEFTPAREEVVRMPCPCCAAETGHAIIAGRELYIEHIEAE